jgi:hypothetical protein
MHGVKKSCVNGFYGKHKIKDLFEDTDVDLVIILKLIFKKSVWRA